MSKYRPIVPTLYALNQIEDKIQDLIELMRTLYPNFNSVRHAGELINHLVHANNWLARLQDEEASSNETDSEE